MAEQDTKAKADVNSTDESNSAKAQSAKKGVKQQSANDKLKELTKEQLAKTKEDKKNKPRKVVDNGASYRGWVVSTAYIAEVEKEKSKELGVKKWTPKKIIELVLWGIVALGAIAAIAVVIATS